MDDAEIQALRAMLDKEAIRDACLKYTRGVDRHDEALAVEAYHDDAVDDHGTYIGNGAGFIKHVNEVHAQNWNWHQHYMTNQTIDLDGDAAHVETYYLAMLRRKNGAIDIAGGRYLDRLEKRDGKWAIADRACLVEWAGDLNQSASIDLSVFLQGSWDRSDKSYQRPLKLTREHKDSLASR